MRRSLHGSRRAALPCALLLLLLFLLSACGSDDDDGGTAPGPGGGTLPQDGSDLQVIGETGLQIMQVGSQLVGQAAQWAAGFGSVKTAGDPTWDAANQWWTWTVEEVLPRTLPNNEARYWTFRVQFYDGQTPQASPEGATHIQAQVELQYSLGLYTSPDDNRTMNVSMTCEVMVGNLAGPAVSVEVDGSGSVFADFTIGGEYREFFTDLVGLHAEMDLTPGACPTGMGVLTVQTTFVEWTYEGGASYGWTVSRQGQTLAEGTATLPCGN